jgi:multiple sugar transport system permease protein
MADTESTQQSVGSVSDGTSSTYREFLRYLKTDQTVRNRIHKAISVIVLIVVLSWLLFPVFWVFETALKTRVVVQSYPPVFFGFEIQWQNFTQVLTQTPLVSYITNGLIMASAATVLSLMLGVPHAYAVSMYKSRLGDASFITIIAARIIPPLSILVPFYVFFSNIGLIDTLIAVTIVETAFLEPFVVWIVKGQFDSMPRSLVDSARVDGCTKFQAFHKIMLPLALQGIVSAGIIAWLLGWNAFSAVFILTTSPAAMTLPVGVLSLANDLYVPWNLVAAASVVGLIPSLIIVIFFQKYLVKGLVDSETQ